MSRAISLLLSVIIGIILGGTTYSYIPGISLTILGIACHLFTISKASGKISHLTRLHFVWPCLLLSGLGAISANLHNPSPKELPIDKEYCITAEVVERQTKTRGEKYIVKLLEVSENSNNENRKWGKCKNIKAYLYSSPTIILEPGDIVRYKSVLEESENYKIGQPQYVTYDVIHIFDYSIKSTGKRSYRYGERSLSIIGHRNNIHTFACEFRERISILLESSSLSHESAELQRALLIGDRSGLDEKRLIEFRDAGVAHALAVSGMHVGVLSAIIIFLLLPLQMKGKRKSRLLLLLSGIWTFTLLTGWHYSTVRASIMLSIILIANLTGRRYSNFRGLCISAIIILLFSPDALWDIGFQLSFTCVAALIVFIEPLNPIEKRSHPILYKIAGAILVSLIATGATWVLCAYYFNSISLNFLIANIIVLPLLPVIMSLGLIYLASYILNIEISFLAQLIDFITGNLFKFLKTISSESIYLETGLGSVILWCAGLILLAMYCHSGHSSARTLPGAMPIPFSDSSTGKVMLGKIYLISSLMMLISSVVIICLS